MNEENQKNREKDENSKNSEKPYILAFALIEKMSPARFEKIKKAFPSFEKAWKAETKDFLFSGIDSDLAEIIAEAKEKIDPKKEWQKLQESDLNFFSKNDEAYPKQLRETKSAPFVLFYYREEKNLEILSKKQLAIVGTRKITNYGKMVTEKIARDLANSGLVVTSGMAQGVDSVAHQAAFESEKPTIAVLGEGILERMKNVSSKKFMEKIVENGGLVLSEYPPNFKATKYTFPARNRIVSGLSLGTLVVEAGERSGALITARLALEENREVFAIPGNVFSDQSIGANNLLKQGAQVVTEVNDILSALNFATASSKTSDAKKENVELSDPEEKIIFEKLSLDPLSIDKIAKMAKLPSATVSTKLSLLELKGLAKNIGGGLFIQN